MAKVLLVDDDEIVRYALNRVLKKAGHTVIEAETGLVALRILNQELPDIIVTDLIMPDQDGLGLITEVRKRMTDLPIIAISGGGRLVSSDFLPFAKDIGANATLTKPFDDNDLVALIDELTSSLGSSR